MEIILTYQGQIKSKSDTELQWCFRKNISAQLKKVWESEHFENFHAYLDSEDDRDPKVCRTVGSTRFIYLFGRPIHVGVRLEILMLTGNPEERFDKRGDTDNYAKRVIDGLRAATKNQKQEIPESEREIQQTIYSLVEDDNAVVSINFERGPLLSSDDPKQSLLIIKVKPYAFRVTFGNIGIIQ